MDMQEPMPIMTIAAASLLAVAIISATILRLWRDWMRFKHSQLSLSYSGGNDRGAASTGNANARIELADLKERLRKLEAIAAGVDL
jgi:hypothetical protein